jgi:hypothetical protein
MRSPLLILFLVFLGIIIVSAARAQTFGPDVLVDTTTVNLTYQAGADLAVDCQGNVGVVWTDATYSNDIISFAKSTDQGQTWQKTVVCDDPLEAPGDDRLYSALAFDRDGNPWVAWYYYIWESIDWFYNHVTHSVDGGVTFQNERCIDFSNATVSTTITVDENNTVYVPSFDSRGLICNVIPEGDYEKQYQTVIDPSSLYAFGFPDFQAAGRDTIFVSFQADSGDYHKPKLIYFTQSTNAGSTFAEPILMSEEAYQTGHYGAQSAQIALGEQNTVYLAWADDRRGDYDVYVSKSTDGGNTFSSSARANNQLEGHQFIVRTSYNSSAGLCIAWTETHDLQDNDIYFSRSMDGGGTFSDSILIGGEENQEFYQGLGGVATDDSGNVYVAYTDGRFGPQLLFVTKAALESTNVVEQPSLIVLPEKATLQQNYPNPFNAKTTIEYSLPAESFVTLSIFNILGEKVRTLTKASVPQGLHSAVWDGRNDARNLVSSGIYFCKLETSEATAVRKLLLLR